MIGRILIVFLAVLLSGCQTTGERDFNWDKFTFGEEVQEPEKQQESGEQKKEISIKHLLPGYNITYKVEHNFYDDIKNPFDAYSVVFYKTPEDTFEIMKFIPKKTEPSYLLTFKYVGDDWRFMDGDVVIDIDGQIFEYQDPNPRRTVLSGGSVLEQVFVQIDNLVRSDVNSIENMRVQCHFEPETITPEGIENIKRFVAEMEEG